MSEILSAIKLKDRIIIISLMLVFAVLLTVGIGAATEATVEPHKHSYEYHLEKSEDGGFDYVGVCADEACEDPIYSRDILNAEESVVPSVKVEPTCTSDGVREYKFKFEGVEYTCEEKIEALSSTYSHTYVAEDTEIKDGSASVTVKCENEGCGGSETLTVSVSDMTFVEKISDASCHAPRVEIYTYSYKGVSLNVTASTEENIPHTLNGVYITELQDESGYIAYGTEGVTLVDVDSLGCGKQAAGSYLCEVCAEDQSVTVVRPGHSFVYMESETILPTLNNIGSATVKCTAEDCGGVGNILLPKVVVGENAEVVSYDQDKESQTIRYTYVDGNYGFTVVGDLVIPWINHQFVFIDEDVVHPTLDADGSVTLKCKNSVCSEERVVTLPKMVEAYNTTVSYYHLLEKKTYTYLYQNTEYGFEITFSYDVPWINHTYVYSADETVNPDFDNDGIAYVRCEYEGCDKYHEISIPKIVMGGNAKVVATATEQSASLVRYNYENKEYSFSVTFDFNVGEPLTHDYKYKLDLNILTGKFDFVGVCNQPGCLEPETRDEDVEVVLEEHDFTCTTDGYIIAYYERDGVMYDMYMKTQNHPGHKWASSEHTNPTFSKEGSVNLYCENDGCTETATVTLPKIEFNVTAFELPDGQLYYLYFFEEYNYEHFFLI